ncbi:MAG TPA: hypothetical protein VIL72_08355 [Beijerinckiaceae bacterium]
MFVDLATLVTLHTLLSFVAIGAGFVAVAGLFAPRVPAWWTLVFLAAAVLTSLTGFLFPFNGVLPSHVVGLVALVVLALVLLARYRFEMMGSWRWVYGVGLVASLYFLVLVAIVQAFMKVAPLNALAPNGSEWPFVATQLAALAVCAWLGWRAARSGLGDRLAR